MPLERIRYIISSSGSTYLCGLQDGGPVLSMDPLDAWRANLMWAAEDVAVMRLKMVQAMFPDANWCLAAVTLISKDLHNWQAASVARFSHD